MIIKIKDIDNVTYINLLYLVRPLVAIALGLCPVIIDNVIIDFIAPVTSFIMINCNKLFDFHAVCTAAVMQVYQDDDYGLCPTCSTPISHYGFKLSLHPNTLVVYYACGTERTIIIKEDKDDESYEIVSNEITKRGVCHTETNEDII